MSTCRPVSFDLRFGYDANPDEIHAALVALGDDALGNLPPLYRDTADSLDRRLVAWGYCIGRIVDNRHQLGIYGDWTISEDDAVVLPALAPFIVPGCSYIFQRAESYGDEYEGWDFIGGGVALRKVRRHVGYTWAD